jgi:hypothetical protein
MKHAGHIFRYAFASAVLWGIVFSSAPARAVVQVRIDIGGAPSPPRFAFRARPHEEYISEEQVYVVEDPGVGDDDCFRYGGYYWVFSDGYWYRSSLWSGPFVVIQPRYVPTVFYRVPAARWKHRPSGPPRFAANGGGNRPVPAPTRGNPVALQGRSGNRPAPTQNRATTHVAAARDNNVRPAGLVKKGADDRSAAAKSHGDGHSSSKQKGAGDHSGSPQPNGGEESGSKKGGGGTLAT